METKTKKMQTTTKTNKEVLSDFLDKLTQMETALLRERILTVMDLTARNIEAYPEQWNNKFIDPSGYIKLTEKVKKYLSY